MRRPFRRYCFFLAEKLGKTVDEILTMDTRDIHEWMAYYRTHNEEWNKTYTKEESLREQREDMDWNSRANLFKQLLGGANGNDK